MFIPQRLHQQQKTGTSQQQQALFVLPQCESATNSIQLQQSRHSSQEVRSRIPSSPIISTSTPASTKTQGPFIVCAPFAESLRSQKEPGARCHVSKMHTIQTCERVGGSSERIPQDPMKRKSGEKISISYMIRNF